MNKFKQRIFCGIAWLGGKKCKKELWPVDKNKKFIGNNIIFVSAYICKQLHKLSVFGSRFERRNKSVEKTKTRAPTFPLLLSPQPSPRSGLHPLFMRQGPTFSSRLLHFGALSFSYFDALVATLCTSLLYSRSRLGFHFQGDEFVFKLQSKFCFVLHTF